MKRKLKLRINPQESVHVSTPDLNDSLMTLNPVTIFDKNSVDLNQENLTNQLSHLNSLTIFDKNLVDLNQEILTKKNLINQNLLSQNLMNRLQLTQNSYQKSSYSKIWWFFGGLLVGSFLDFFTVIVMILLGILIDNQPILHDLTPQDLISYFAKSSISGFVNLLRKNKE
jgi:hypothetical protein